jgi:hypothetical protein
MIFVPPCLANLATYAKDNALGSRPSAMRGAEISVGSKGKVGNELAEPSFPQRGSPEGDAMFSELFAPEVLFGAGAVILLAALIYGAIRAGHLSWSEKARTDAATRRVQQQEESRQ